VPPLIGHLDRTQNLHADEELKTIKTSFNLVVVQDSLRSRILDKKIPWVKFKKNVIITSNMMNENKILVCVRNMKDILKY
jgi:hypothetical protein